MESAAEPVIVSRDLEKSLNATLELDRFAHHIR